jgi:cell division protein FtsZ
MCAIGIGGAGCKVLARLTEMGLPADDCVAIDTDPCALGLLHMQKVLVDKKEKQQAISRIGNALTNKDIVFVIAGLGGAAATAFSPVVTEIARKEGAIAIGVFTEPSKTEKKRVRYRRALNGIQKRCDTFVVIDIDRFSALTPQALLTETFRVANQVLANMVYGIVQTLSTPSLVNLDIGDFKKLMRQGGIATLGVGESDAINRAEQAVRNALKHPFSDLDCSAATGALVQIEGDNRMTIEEANRAGEIVNEIMGAKALVTCGARISPQQLGRLHVTLLMTGLDRARPVTGFGAIAPTLFNMDADAGKTAPVSLNLYQMESP